MCLSSGPGRRAEMGHSRLPIANKTTRCLTWEVLTGRKTLDGGENGKLPEESVQVVCGVPIPMAPVPVPALKTAKKVAPIEAPEVSGHKKSGRSAAVSPYLVMERVKGVEPSTSTLARSRSTTELHPLCTTCLFYRIRPLVKS